ncbi:MAG: DinB family protein, partial [Planctomycetota bacterium]
FSPALNKIYSIRVRDVLTHVCTHNLHEADFIWIEVLHHEAKNDIDDARFRTVAELEAALAQMDPRWNTYIEHVTPASLETEVQRFSPALNKIYSIRVRDVLTHVCTHNLYTLAQAANIIRRLGGEVPPTDFPMWVLAGRPG